MSKNKLKLSSRLLKKKIRKQAYLNPKHCRFCWNKELENALDYKNIMLLREEHHAFKRLFDRTKQNSSITRFWQLQLPSTSTFQRD